MKTLIVAITTLGIAAGAAQNSHAGDREWATAGKILTGVAAGILISKAFEPAPVYTTVTYAPAPVVYAPPPPQVVYVHAPPPVSVAPAPVVVHRRPIVAPAPVVVHHAPVVVAPAPVVMPPPVVHVHPAPVIVRHPRPVGFHVSFGRSYCPPPVYRVCR